MHEALGGAIRYAFDELRLHRIMANDVPTNERAGGFSGAWASSSRATRATTSLSARSFEITC